MNSHFDTTEAKQKSAITIIKLKECVSFLFSLNPLLQVNSKMYTLSPNDNLPSNFGKLTFEFMASIIMEDYSQVKSRFNHPIGFLHCK